MGDPGEPTTTEVERLLRQARNEWTATVDTVTDLIVLEDSNGCVLRCNLATANFFAASFPSLIGKPLVELFFPGRKLSEMPRCLRDELAVLQFPGHDEWYEVSNYPMAIRLERGASWVHVCRDVTERKRLESIAEAVNTMDNVGYVFMSLRHELGNPINSIKTALSVLRKNLDLYPRATVAEYLDRTLVEVGRVEYLLKVLRTFNMYENPRAERGDVRRFLEDFCRFIRSGFETQGITVRTGFEPQLSEALFDPRALHQVLLNLVTNAVDALAQNPEPCLTIRAKSGPRSAVITVGDNGIGMTEEQQANLFRPFYTAKSKGTGLGLVIVKKLVTGMGGTVSVASRRGAGTEVTLTLPGVASTFEHSV